MNHSWIPLATFLSPLLTTFAGAQPAPHAKQPNLEAKHLLTIDTGFQETQGVAFSPDGKRVVAASTGNYGPIGEIGIWEVATGKRLVKIETDGTPLAGYLQRVAFHPDGMSIASASTGHLAIWDAQTGKLIRPLNGHLREVSAVQFSADGKRLVSAGGDMYDGKRFGEVKVWDVATGKEIHDFKGHTYCVRDAKISRDGKRIVSISGDRTVRLWNAGTGKPILTGKIRTGQQSCVAINRDGTRFVTGGNEIPVELWDSETGKVLRAIDTPHVCALAFSHDDKWIIGSPTHGGSTKVGRIIVWDAATGNEVLNFKALPWVIHDLEISPDGQRIVCGGHSSGDGRRNVTVWALKNTDR